MTMVHMTEEPCASKDASTVLKGGVTRLPTKPERIMAIAFIMVLCLLVYKLAEVRVRQRLAATGQTVPDQVRKPTARPTLRWLFQCFEGIDLHHTVLHDG